jgi:Arc/MetJ-type ribon-helix-helix transcriptional regulator
MTVELTPEAAQAVADLVNQGAYPTAEAAVAEALERLKVEAFQRQAVAEAIREADQGLCQTVDLQALLAEVRQKLQEAGKPC